MTEPLLDPEEEIKFAAETITGTKEKLRAVMTIAYRHAVQLKQWRNLATTLKEILDEVKSKQEVSCGWCGQVFGTVERTNVAETKKVLEQVAEHAWGCAQHPFNQKMPCGHEARYAYPPTGDQGTTFYCLVCASLDQNEQHDEEIKELRDNLKAENARLRKLLEPIAKVWDDWMIERERKGSPFENINKWAVYELSSSQANHFKNASEALKGETNE